MKHASDLKRNLFSIDGKSYSMYKELRGSYRFDGYILSLDRIQGDPFAPPSALSLQIPFEATGIPAEYLETKNRRITLQDYLTRRLAKEMEDYSFKARGSGKSGLIAISRCGQTVLERTACRITEKAVFVRFHVGFPANGRRINGRELEKILFQFLPMCAEEALFYRNMNPKHLERTIFLSDDQQFIREELKKRGLAAFVAEGAVLPRKSGVSDLPMKGAVPFQSPDSLKVTMELPHQGRICGMGIPCGISLIAGGGYHGKSTLLNALESAVYNHIPGDGREYVICDDTAVKLRSEDGRFIKDADISMFINDLPNGKDTRCFSTLDASGSTSQAAGISESIETGSSLFLIDEDTSATNFMVRDAFMQRVISRSKEPITPFVERARQLYEQAGISTILVAGSSGAFFHIADTVIQMDSYRPFDITEKVKELCHEYPDAAGMPPAFHLPESRRIMSVPKELQRERQRRPLKVKVHGIDSFSIGKETVDLRYVEQLEDGEQTASLGRLLEYALEHLTDGKRTIPQIVSLLEETLESEGLESLFSGSAVCGFARPRKQEIAACFNRFRR